MISILLPTKTRLDLLPQAFGSCMYQLESCPEEWEFIVINDNPPQSQADDILNRYGIQFIRGPMEGSAAAFHAGASAANGDILLFINDDCIFFQPFIHPMLQSFKQGYSIVGAKLLYENMTIQHAGMEFLPQYEWTANHIYRGYPYDAEEVNEWKEMPCVTFSCTLVDAQLFYKLGGFSPDYGGENYSDVDFCLRALELGYKICYEPRAEVIHLESQTRGHDLEKNTETFNTFKDKWVRTNKLPKLLKETGFA